LLTSAPLERLRAKRLTKLPSSQRSLIADGQPLILEIVVTEAKDAQKQSKDAKD
jgi:hypothetical protein